jgi:tRNA(Ile2) C34 agmatinyltransferase TiaS
MEAMTAELECPHCGASFKKGRLACPECGSDARTGWASQDEIDYQSVEIPDFYEDPESAGRGLTKAGLIAAVLALLGAVTLALFAR